MKKPTIMGILLLIGGCLLYLFLVDEISGFYRALITGLMLGGAFAYKNLLEEN